jgi:hypothetical protein
VDEVEPKKKYKKPNKDEKKALQNLISILKKYHKVLRQKKFKP